MSILPNVILQLARFAFQLNTFGTATSKTQDLSLLSMAENTGTNHHVNVDSLAWLWPLFGHMPYTHTMLHNPTEAHL